MKKVANTKTNYKISSAKNTITLSVKDLKSIRETLYFYSIPGYVDSIKKAYEETDWDKALEYNPDKDWNKW